MILNRAYYSDAIEAFLALPSDAVLGQLARGGSGSLELEQRDAWVDQIRILKSALTPYAGRGILYLEYAVPRLGKRIDAVAVIDHAVFVIEFKVGEREFTAAAIDQVWDYALDLKNFHETSHSAILIPVLVATRASAAATVALPPMHDDMVVAPIEANDATLGTAINAALSAYKGQPIDPHAWGGGRYCPTPTIIEAALALYHGHSVAEISRSDAGAINLTRTSDAIDAIIRESAAQSRRTICFITGVPGAGKTLAGLNVATRHLKSTGHSGGVFLSGNGPLVAILREALTRDVVRRAAAAGQRIAKGSAHRTVASFVQNVHHYRDECLRDAQRPPVEHVAIFDEAQRAWNLHQTAKFMKQKKGHPNFAQSEPEFLISCLDRHRDWAVIVCLVGGGQEINTGEAGIGEWIRALVATFPEWSIHISERLHDTEYAAGSVLQQLSGRSNVRISDDLHLGVSMRSFRAEHVSALVKALLDLDRVATREAFGRVGDRYPIALTRDLNRAKEWLRSKARGSERYGLLASSQAERLKPHAINVRAPVNPIHWFLADKTDVRSSFYLEDAATEFDVQGLELDWAGVVWDGDFRYSDSGWGHFSFVGDQWNRIRKTARQSYLKNAYRVLLTRARQGLVIVVPQGSGVDPTRCPEYYDSTYEYLERIGFEVL